MTKLKDSCRYELFCLINEKNKNEDKYKKFISEITKKTGEENLEKVETTGLKTSYKINSLTSGTYVLINFNSSRKIAHEIEKEILEKSPKNFLNRYLLINLEKENKITEKKTREKNVE